MKRIEQKEQKSQELLDRAGVFLAEISDPSHEPSDKSLAKTYLLWKELVGAYGRKEIETPIDQISVMDKYINSNKDSFPVFSSLMNLNVEPMTSLLDTGNFHEKKIKIMFTLAERGRLSVSYVKAVLFYEKGIDQDGLQNLFEAINPNLKAPEFPEESE